MFPGGGRPQLDSVPSQIGTYRILREIGRGGMGAVYEALQAQPQPGPQGDAAFGNKPAGGSTLADELRLNSSKPSGWPNGRTLTDDVVDTALEAFDGLTCGLATPPCTAGSLATSLGDGVSKDADNPTPAATFPYLNDPTLP